MIPTKHSDLELRRWWRRSGWLVSRSGPTKNDHVDLGMVLRFPTKDGEDETQATATHALGNPNRLDTVELPAMCRMLSNDICEISGCSALRSSHFDADIGRDLNHEVLEHNCPLSVCCRFVRSISGSINLDRTCRTKLSFNQKADNSSPESHFHTP